jgi:linoleoyl-CoA desaturase
MINNAIYEDRRLTFRRDDGFHAELRRRVDDYFHLSGRRQRDCPEMYLKTAIILLAFFGAYIGLVFFAATWWQGLGLAILLGLSMAGIGFTIEHDGGHQAYSNHQWINRAMAKTMDLLGASSYLWHWKHDVIHHTYTNVHGQDTDIEVGFIGRLSPHQRHLGIHRFQHFYLWPLYGLNVIKWQLYDDFHDIIRGRIGARRIPRPTPLGWFYFIGAKVAFYGMAFVIPLMFNSVLSVLVFYVATVFTASFVVSIVFQLAHCVEEAEFTLPDEKSTVINNSWAIQQIETTVNFSRDNKLQSWFLGGLNFQVEHHLFPRICHIHYPEISKLVEETCLEYGVKYRQHRTFRGGLLSHFRWLRSMGAAPASS